MTSLNTSERRRLIFGRHGGVGRRESFGRRDSLRSSMGSMCDENLKYRVEGQFLQHVYIIYIYIFVSYDVCSIIY